MLVQGRDVRTLSPSQLSCELAYVPQNASISFSYTVLDCVLMGTAGSVGLFSSPSKEDEDRAFETLHSLGISDIAAKPCNRISGGERQLMLIARALVQRAKILVLDEPTASLDYGNIYSVMDRVAALTELGYTVLFSTHQPEIALRYGPRTLALQGARLIADGPSHSVITPALLHSLYGLTVHTTSVQTPHGAQTAFFPNTKGDS